MRKLKFHETKLIRKTNFLEWKREGGHRENLITRRYHMGGRDDYKKFVTFLFCLVIVMNNGCLVLEFFFLVGSGTQGCVGWCRS